MGEAWAGARRFFGAREFTGHLDDFSGRGFLKWREFAEMLSVAKGDSARAIDFDCILVELTDFNHHSCPLPFLGVVPSEILEIHMVPHS